MVSRQLQPIKIGEKEFSAKPNEARSSAKSGTKNLKSSFLFPFQGEAGGEGGARRAC